MNALARSCLGLALAGLLPLAVHAAGIEIFAGADLALGERLISEHACAECHGRHVGGDGSAIYRPQGRISTPGALHTMVQYCSSQLDLKLFPEEVTAIAAVLQRDHYRFK
jgi:cytochrome c553